MIFNLSGGLIYHFRALRRWQKAWAPFREALSKWATPELSRFSEIVLVGPSGGYCVPEEWLRGKKRVVAFDIDPRASFFWKRVHETPAEFHRMDFFQGGFEELEALGVSPSSPIVFCNLLGQLEYIRRDHGEVLKALAERLRV